MDYFQKTWNFLNGKKTYIIGVVSILHALASLWEGSMSVVEASVIIQIALTGLGLRHGISKINN